MGKIFWDYKQMVRLTISSFNTNQSLDFKAFIHFIGCLFDLIGVYKVVFDSKVIKDLKNIDRVWQEKILEKIEEVLTARPYDGKKLVGDMSNFYRLRVADYRVVYEIFEDTVTVEIIKIAHRKEVY